MKQNIKKVYVLVIILLTCLPLIGGLLGLKQSNDENRQLHSFPKISLNFTKEFEAYWQDQFPFRNSMITLFNQINQSLFNYSGNNKVVLGKNKMLFLSETLDDFQNNRSFTDTELLKIKNIYQLIHQRLAEDDIRLTLMIVPNKNSIYPQLMPYQYKPVSNSDNYDNILELEVDFDVINLKTAFLNQPQQLYHLYDSHYNNLGAALTSDILIETLTGESPHYFERKFDLETNFKGDLSSILYPGVPIFDENMNFNLTQDFLFTRPIQSVDDITIKTLNQNKTRSLYLIRDSFGRALIPFISNEFERVIYSRRSPYNFIEVMSEKVDDVVVEITERNLFHWIKSTPIILLKPSSQTIKTQFQYLSVKPIQSNQHQLNLLNIEVVDQSLGQKITEAYLKIDSLWYPLFPVYNAGEFDSKDFKTGLSAYFNQEINLANSTLIYNLNGTWYESTIE